MKYYLARPFIQEKIRTFTPQLAYSVDEDFNEWKKKSVEKLEDLLGFPFDSCEDEFQVIKTEQHDNYLQTSFEFQSEPGYYIRGEFLLPNTIVGKVPVVICLQGHTSGKHVSLGEEKFEQDKNWSDSHFAIQAVNEGMAAVAIEQRYMGETGQSPDGTPGCIMYGEALPSLLVGRSPIGERVWDVKRVIDILENYMADKIDKEKIICLGNSGGGTATFYSACVEPRISLAVPSCAVCTFEDSIVDVQHCGCNYLPGIRKYFNMADLGCLIAPRKVIVVCGIHDEIFPVKGVEETFHIMKSAFEKNANGENCQLVKGDGGHKFYPEETWPVIHKMLAK